MDIGGKIKKSRTDAKITQEQAAQALGISRQTISNWENERSYPDIVSVLKMSDLYSVSLATVYKGNIIKNLIMDCQSYTKYRPNETTGGIFVSWRGKEELPTGLD